MRKFELYVVANGSRRREPIVCNGFVEAEKKAKELFEEVYKDYPNRDETYIECVEAKFMLSCDHLVMSKDCFGDIYWRTLIMGDFMPLYIDLLSDGDKKLLEAWREEKELHVTDLCERDLKDLYYQVSFGSIYLSDYENDAYIDTEEVSNVCENYERWIEENKKEHSSETFVDYIMNYL